MTPNEQQPIRNPSPKSRRLALIVIALIAFIAVTIFVGLNANHVEQGPQGGQETEGQASPTNRT